MSRFKPGQEIVCVKDFYRADGPKLPTMKKGEIVTYQSAAGVFNGYQLIYVREYRGKYAEVLFEPLQDLSEQIKEALTEKVTI